MKTFLWVGNGGGLSLWTQREEKITVRGNHKGGLLVVVLCVWCGFLVPSASEGVCIGRLWLVWITFIAQSQSVRLIVKYVGCEFFFHGLWKVYASCVCCRFTPCLSCVH